MRLSLRAAILFVLALTLPALAAGQKPATAPAPVHKPVPRKRYCQPDGGFCFKYPGSWTMLGEVYDGNGVVVAPPQKLDKHCGMRSRLRSSCRRPEGDEEPVSLDGMIEQASKSMREGGQSVRDLAAPAAHRGPQAGADAEGALSRESDRSRLGRGDGLYSRPRSARSILSR